jgi:hypothetical protein
VCYLPPGEHCRVHLNDWNSSWQFSLDTREHRVTSYEASIDKLRHFCSVCGSYLGDGRSTPARFVVRLTALDDDQTIKQTIALNH